jgi:S54 family peptidase
MGTLCAFGFLNHGPQRPEPFADETDEEEESPEEDINDHNTTDSTDITS